MTFLTYGRKVTGNDIGWGYTGENVDNLRATVFGPMDGNGIVYALGLRCGYKDLGDPVGLKLAMHKTNAGNPSSQICVTGNQAVNTRMVDNTDGTYYEIDVLAPAHVEDGKKYGLVLLSDGGRLTVGQNVDGTTMYFRDYSPSTPPDPMGYTSASPEGKISIWALIERDVDPDIPTNVSPADGATLTTTTPTYAADFRDTNETLPNGLSWDYLQAYQIQVRQVAAINAITGTLVWDSGVVTASSTERTNRRLSRTHPAGSPLTAGLRYQMRCAVQDRGGNWSDYTSWTSCDFLINSAGVVTLDGTPTGKTEITTGQNFQWRWFHATSLNADRVKIRLLNGASIIKTSPELVRSIASSALPGTLNTITWAETTFADLSAGVTTYGYQVQARDTLGSWTDWSPIRAFSTNAPPSVPTALQPDGSTPVTERPLLTMIFTDSDDTTATGLTGEVRIKNSGGTLLQTRTATYNATTGRWDYQTIAADLAAIGTYRFDGRSYDGTAYSAYSQEITFVWANGPTVTIDSPTEGEVIATNTPLYDWTTVDQQKKQINLWDDGSGELVHDSTLLVDTTTSYLQPANILRTGHGYRLVVAATNSAPLTGTSQIRRFSVAYTPPDPVAGFVASPELAAYDVVPSAVLTSWVPWPGDPATFRGYRLRRRDSGLPIDRSIAIAYFSNQEQASWIDYLPPNAVEQTYSLEVLVQIGLDQLASLPAESPATIRLRGSVLCDVRDGAGTRLVFDSVTARARAPYRDQVELPTWEGGPPFIYEGPTAYDTIKLGGKLRRTPDVDLPELEAQFNRLIGIRADKSPVIACYRDDLNRRMFLRLRKPQFADEAVRVAVVQLEGTETIYNEEVTIP